MHIAFQSYKSHHVTRSVLAAEVIAFTDLFDDTFALKDTIEKKISKSVQFFLVTDSKSLFGIISKGSRTNEKRLMLDVHTAH